MASQPTRPVTYPPFIKGLLTISFPLIKPYVLYPAVPLISGGGYVRVGRLTSHEGETRLLEGRVLLDVVGPKI